MTYQAKPLALLVAGSMVCLAVILQATGLLGAATEHQGTTQHAARTTIDFETVADLDPIGNLSSAVFAKTWRGVLDSNAGELFGISNESPPNTVAMLWGSPDRPIDTRITFFTTVKSIAFDYSLDSSFGTPTVVFYDQSGIEIGERFLDACGATGCGSPCSRGSSDDLCHFNHVEFSAPLGRRIAFIEFEGAGGIFGRFALDDLSIVEPDPIFLDDFETGTTDRWDSTVGSTPTPSPTPTPTDTPDPPECSDFEVGAMYRSATNQVRIDSVSNRNPNYSLTIQRVDFSWDWVHLDQYLDYLRLDQIGSISEGDFSGGYVRIYTSIPIQPNRFSEFTAGWAGWDHQTIPVSGYTNVVFRFVYDGGGLFCGVSRSITIPTYTPTFTPTVGPRIQNKK